MIFHLLSNEFLSFVLGCFISLSILLCLGSIIYFILYFINTIYTSSLKIDKGVIIREKYEFGDDKIIMINDTTTNSLIPTLQYENKLWTVIIKVNGKTDEVEVSEEDYNRYNVGEYKNVQYVVGKIWKVVFIKKILD